MKILKSIEGNYVKLIIKSIHVDFNYDGDPVCHNSIISDKFILFKF